MIKKLLLSFVCTLMACTMYAQNHDLERAKSLIRYNRFTEGAKLLRPLADGGDAEAQYMAAQLFFNGTGVVQSDAQGVKYATMSAKSGRTDALVLLIKHYSKTNTEQGVQVLKTYLTSFPHKAADLRDEMADESVRNTVNAYFKEQAQGCPDVFEAVEKIYKNNPAEGELLMSIAFEDEQEGYRLFSECMKRTREGHMTPACEAVMAKLCFEGKGAQQNYSKGMEYAKMSASKGSAMGKYMIQMYEGKRMPGYYFKDAVIFHTDKKFNTDKAFSRNPVMHTWQETLAEMRKSRTWRLPTMDEAKLMMPYYTMDREMKAGETVTIWVTRLPTAEVYFWQTYNHEGKVIKEEPHHSFMGSHYNGKALMLTILEVDHKE